MFSERMLRIIRSLKKEGQSSYKELSKQTGISERCVRYDIERVNAILSLERLPQVEKRPKGILVYPDQLDLKGLEKGNAMICTSKERIAAILLLLMIRQQDLKINQLSQQFQVSRTTIKNDMAALDGQLKQEGMGIGYSDHFYLTGPKLKRIALMDQEFRKYIGYLINPPTEYDSYRFFCVHIIHKAYEGVSIPSVIMAVDGLLEELGCTLTTNSYLWYMSNVLVIVWCIIHGKDHPLEVPKEPGYDQEIFGRFKEKLEKIIGMQLSARHLAMIARMLDYTNKISGEKVDTVDVDPVYVQMLTYDLVAAMSRRVEIGFDRDHVLLEGLMNHMVPLVQRIRSHIRIKDDIVGLLRPEERQLYPLVGQACTEVELLKDLNNEDEVAYLTICFMASIHRMKAVPCKKVLLVCGHGYGTTTMLKETLLSEYQIHILDTLPIYRLSAFRDWTSVDLVLSTILIGQTLPKPCLVVNPLLQPEDRSAIEHMGIMKKTILSSYYSIEEKLGFLDPPTREKVMKVICKELGYQTALGYQDTKRFSSFLRFDCIRYQKEAVGWHEAVRISGAMLKEGGYIGEEYIEEIIRFMEEKGFYAVTDGSFALLHAKGNAGVYRTGMSLLMTAEPVIFGEKKARAIFCLASRDAKEHIPAVTALMRMIKSADLIPYLERCRSEEELYQTVLDREFEAL